MLTFFFSERNNKDFAKELSKIWMCTITFVVSLKNLINIFLLLCHLSQQTCYTLWRIKTHTLKVRILAVSTVFFKVSFYLFFFFSSVANMLCIFDATTTKLKGWVCSSLFCYSEGIIHEKQGSHILHWYCMYIVSGGPKCPLSFACKVVTFPQLSSYR